MGKDARIKAERRGVVKNRMRSGDVKDVPKSKLRRAAVYLHRALRKSAPESAQKEQ